MRVSGSLFTFSELSASVADGTFTQKTGSVLIQSDECVTVASASALVNIETIFGSSFRYPFYNELVSSSISGSGSGQTLEYTFINSLDIIDFSFALYINDTLIVDTNIDTPATVISLNVGDTISVYCSLANLPPYSCDDGFIPTLSVYNNGAFEDFNSGCPVASSGPYTVSANDNWQITAEVQGV